MCQFVVDPGRAVPHTLHHLLHYLLPLQVPPGRLMHGVMLSWLPLQAPSCAVHHTPCLDPSRSSPGSSAGSSRCISCMQAMRASCIEACRLDSWATSDPCCTTQLHAPLHMLRPVRASTPVASRLCLQQQLHTLTSEMGAPLRSRSCLMSAIWLTAAAAKAREVDGMLACSGCAIPCTSMLLMRTMPSAAALMMAWD